MPRQAERTGSLWSGRGGRRQSEKGTHDRRKKEKKRKNRIERKRKQRRKLAAENGGKRRASRQGRVFDVGASWPRFAVIDGASGRKTRVAPCWLVVLRESLQTCFLGQLRKSRSLFVLFVYSALPQRRGGTFFCTSACPSLVRQGSFTGLSWLVKPLFLIISSCC